MSARTASLQVQSVDQSAPPSILYPADHRSQRRLDVDQTAAHGGGVDFLHCAPLSPIYQHIYLVPGRKALVKV